MSHQHDTFECSAMSLREAERRVSALYANDIVGAYGLSVALLATFCSKYGLGVLRETGRFECPWVKPRMRATERLVMAPVERGFHDAVTQAAIERINAIHGMYGGDITNAEFLFTLSTFVAGSAEGAEALLGPLGRDDKEALAVFWRHLGERMGLTEMPRTFGQFQTHYLDGLAATDDANELALRRRYALNSIRYGAELHVPMMLAPLAQHLTSTALPPRLRALLGLPEVHGWHRALARWGLWALSVGKRALVALGFLGQSRCGARSVEEVAALGPRSAFPGACEATIHGVPNRHGQPHPRAHRPGCRRRDDSRLKKPIQSYPALGELGAWRNAYSQPP